jgi:hypothetical protein
MKDVPDRLEVSIEELVSLLDKVRTVLGEDDYRKLHVAIRTLSYVTELLESREATLERLRRLLCHRNTEKTETVLKQAGIDTGKDKRNKPGDSPAAKKSPGHGRNKASAYRGARKVEVRHESLHPGDSCPGCQRGKVYLQSDPGLLVRIKGQAPLAATVYELEKLRCNLCGDLFTAAAPEQAGVKKYDETAASMIAMLRYGSGFPWTRLEGLQRNLGIPLPKATQCQIVNSAATGLRCALDELIRQAAQSGLQHNDDTSMRVLSLDPGVDGVGPERTGVFTSGIVSVEPGYRIALYFTGRKHAGENIADLLAQRDPDRKPPIQMCDALSWNVSKLPAKLEVIVGNCLTHARRHFVEVIDSFPEQCRFVLEKLGEVYGHDEATRSQRMDPEQRLAYHQAHSGPAMKELHARLSSQLEHKIVEPNSGLGKAISYLLRHWSKLTLFLRQAGAPLDNNVCERALKKAILHRKNSLFYKTRNGAMVGDLFMSLIHTCELNKVDPFDYLTQLQLHAGELAREPSEWMPWNYRDTLARTGALLNAA